MFIEQYRSATMIGGQVVQKAVAMDCSFAMTALGYAQNQLVAADLLLEMPVLLDQNQQMLFTADVNWSHQFCIEKKSIVTTVKKTVFGHLSSWVFPLRDTPARVTPYSHSSWQRMTMLI
jgi:hypothetical protein